MKRIYRMLVIKSFFWSLFYIGTPYSAPGITPHKVTKIIIEKNKRRMTLIDEKGKTLKVYKVSLGFSPKGHKQQEGDGKTPEGTYKVTFHNAHSQFHKSLKINYPTPSDQKAAEQRGKDPGGDIFIHGLGKSFSYLGKNHILHDWTLGCIAVTNEEIDEIFSLVKDSTPVIIQP